MKKYLCLIGLILAIGCSSNKGKNVEQLKIRQQKLLLKKAEITKEIKELEEQLTLLGYRKPVQKLIGTTKSKVSNFTHTIRFTAYVESHHNSSLVPDFNGRLEKIYVKIGDKVKKGDKIAKIDDGGLSTQLEQLKVNASLAKTSFERQERLWKQKIGSEIQYLNAKANKETTQKAVKQLEERLDKIYVKAPFSGTIDDIFPKIGEMMFAGQSIIAQIINLDKMYVKADIPENYIGQFKLNSLVDIYIPVLNKTIQGTLYKISNIINPYNRSFSIEIELNNKDKSLKPNLLAEIQIVNYQNPRAIVIEENLIGETADGKNYIFIIEQKDNNFIAKKCFIQKGYTQNNLVEVKEGLREGVLIAKEGHQSLKDGEKVRIKR